MSVRVTMLLALIALAGCQAAGPGVQVEVRAEPKTGYKPPPDDFMGTYGSSSSSIDVGVTPHDHTYHLIDYRRLEGIVVWVKPNAYATASVPVAQPPPLGATVDVSSRKPARLEDFALASVGGRVTVKPAGTYVIRSSVGDVVEVSGGNPTFNATRPGLFEILSDDGDEPIGSFYVAPASWAKKVRGGDRAKFAPLPQGMYVVGAWHPILPGSDASVQVTADKLSKVTLKVGVNSLPKPGR